jgi:predicted nucleic acid-binding protein
MQRSVLVDSSVFIHRMRRRLDPFDELSQFDSRYDFYSCGVVKMEVCRGISIPRIYGEAKERFEVMFWVPTTDQVWGKALEIAWSLARQGVIMQLTDIVIAASALSVDAAVFTLDSDFHYVPDLQVINDLG